MLSSLAVLSVGACMGVLSPPAQMKMVDKVTINQETIASFAAFGMSVTPEGKVQAGIIDVGRKRDLWIVGNGEWIMSDRDSGDVLASGTVWSGVGDETSLLLRLIGPKVALDGRISPNVSGNGTLDFQGQLDWGKINGSGVPARLIHGQGAADGGDLVAIGEICLCVCSNGDFVYTGCSVIDCTVQNRCEAGSCPTGTATPAPPAGEGDGEVEQPVPGGDLVADPIARQKNTSCRNVDPNGSWLGGVGFLAAVGLAGGTVARRRMR